LIDKSDRRIVVIPTYNEIDNIRDLVPAVLRLESDLHVLIVDDASPDGTGTWVKFRSISEDRLHLLERVKKEGLGPAYEAGFSWALDNGFAIIGQMDADFSHRVGDLRCLLSALGLPEAAGAVDFVIGSRWVPGGRIKNWAWWRWLLSFFGNAYIRLILGSKIRDWTGGFNVWRSKVLRRVLCEPLTAQGYCFQAELKARALRLNFQGQEVPILFEERRMGLSKMSWAIFVEALVKIWQIRKRTALWVQPSFRGKDKQKDLAS
jgi:dolichol-phosphate mannosyltransferase